MTRLEYLICEAERSGEIDLDTRNQMLDVLTEKLETRLLGNFSRKMTLYHTSRKELKTIKPIGVNIGTKLSKARNSSFWSNSRDGAIMWALLYNLPGSNAAGAVSFEDKCIYILSANDGVKSEKDMFLDYLDEHPIYIYTAKDVPVKEIGRGQYSIDEYTLDKEIKPDKKERVTKSDVVKFIKELPPDEFIKAMRTRCNLDGRNEKRLMNKLIFRKYNKVSDRRGKIIQAGMSDYRSGIGNNRYVDGSVMINPKDYKHIK